MSSLTKMNHVAICKFRKDIILSMTDFRKSTLSPD